MSSKIKFNMFFINQVRNYRCIYSQNCKVEYKILNVIHLNIINVLSHNIMLKRGKHEKLAVNTDFWMKRRNS